LVPDWDAGTFGILLNMKKVLGVDIGGVIFDFAPIFKTNGDVTEEEILHTPVMEGSIESLSVLNKTLFKDSIYLVSKYGEDGPKSIQKWLEKQNFYERTGIAREHLFQCAERHEKAPIVKDLGITHFVDDRAEVMSHFSDFVPNLYHFQSILEDRNEWAKNIPNMTFVESWSELLRILNKE